MTKSLGQFKHYWAVTDQQEIIHIKEVRRVYKGELTQVITSMVNPETNHTTTHHEAYFKEMWILEGETKPKKQNVFHNEDEAVTYAIKHAECKLDTAKVEVENLNGKLRKLQQQ